MAALSLLVGALLSGVGSAIYPEDHWKYATELSTDNADDFVKKGVDAGKTAPSWNEVVKKFAGSEDVAFGDVSLSKNQVRDINGVGQNPGAGGWPTLRYFNKATGYGGEAYKQKTDKAMCDELGPKEDYMQMFIEEAGGTSLCNVNKSDQGCTDQQKKFIAKWADKDKDELQKQMDRLSGMIEKDAASMKADALTWVKQRLNIVKQFNKAKDEL